MARSSPSISGVAQAKIDWKTSSITATKISVPQNLCVNTTSRRSLNVIRRWPDRLTAPSKTPATQS